MHVPLNRGLIRDAMPAFFDLLRGWRNWQTQRTQNPPGFGPWGFDSPLPAPVETVVRVIEIDRLDAGFPCLRSVSPVRSIIGALPLTSGVDPW
jgi:hypothetical protein